MGRSNASNPDRSPASFLPSQNKENQKTKRTWRFAMSFVLAHTLPQVLAETLLVSYCRALYWAAVALLGSVLIVAHSARVAPAASTVTDLLNFSTASGLEQ